MAEDLTHHLLTALSTQPLTWIALMLAMALWQLARQRLAAGRRWVVAALAALLLLGWMPLPVALMQWLETRYTPAGPDLSGYVGVVVLGGAFVGPAMQAGREQVQLNAQAERLTEAVALARSHPELAVVFTGGCADGDGCVPEAVLARRFFEHMGLPPERVVYEAASRTTYENALLSAQLPGVDITRPWLLLTSAWHMPRAMAVFRAQGWNVTPLPADFRGLAQPDWQNYSLGRGLENWQLALHELVGLLAYRLTGKA